MNPEQQNIQTLTEIIGELKDQVTDLRENTPHHELKQLRQKVDAQQQQIVQLSEFVSLVTEAIPGEIFPSYHLTPGGQTDGIDIQHSGSRERTRRRAAKAVRQIATGWNSPYPARRSEPAPSPARGGRVLPDR